MAVLFIVTVAAAVLFCFAAGTLLALLLDVLSALVQIIMSIILAVNTFPQLATRVRCRKPEDAEKFVYPPHPSRIDIKH